jgi:G3E family GTPase
MPADATSPQSQPRRPPPPFDLVVVTGFLGAGKTTLLNRLLRDPALSDTLVLINEFGSVGLDHHLVERVDGDMLVMTSGCLCCSIRGDLIATLEDALRARDNGRMSPFTRVLIETTGLADPAPVLHTVMAHPYLRLRFRLQAVVTLVDAVVGDATLDAHQEAVKQVAMADRLVLSKADLAGDTAPLEARLRRLNPGAPLFRADKASVADLLGGVSYDPVARGADAKAWLAAEALEQAHKHHHHDVNRHDALPRSAGVGPRRPAAALQGARGADRRPGAAGGRARGPARRPSPPAARVLAGRRPCDAPRLHRAGSRRSLCRGPLVGSGRRAGNRSRRPQRTQPARARAGRPAGVIGVRLR